MHYDVVMEVVFKELSTLMPSMPVEYSKDLDFGPVSRFGQFRLWLNHVQDDRDSVFVCLAHSTNICVGGETSDTAESLRTQL